MPLRPVRIVALLLALGLVAHAATSPAAPTGPTPPPGAPGPGPGGQPANPPTGTPLRPTNQPPTPPETATPTEPTPAEPFPEARRYYPPRPASADKLSPELMALLDEIEGEAVDELPLFGQDIFRQQIIDRYTRALLPREPIAAPPPSYRLAPGDEFTVVYWNDLVDPVTVEAQVQPDGTVGFGPVDPVQVNGLTPAELREILTRAIRRRGPREATVRITFTGLHAIRVRVTGEVRRGNRWVVISGYATLLDALAEAGGPTRAASLRSIKLTRDGVERTLDLYPALLEGDALVDEVLRDGDRIHVYPARRLVGVDGGIVRPRRYELVAEQTLRAVLELAGGVLPRAVSVQVSRVADFREEMLIDLGLAAVVNGDPTLATVEPPRHGDLVRIVELGDAGRQVTIQGAVVAEGVFGFRPNLTLGELVALAQGVHAEGSAATGTIRRARDDGLPEFINFQVADVRAGGAAAGVPLQPGDVVTIPRLTDRPELTVSVRGAVNEPNQYRAAGRFTVADLVTAAGGPAPGAALARAVLTSNATGQPVDQPIDLSPLAEGGAPQPNPLLSNGDALFIPFLPDVGAAPNVRVDGFVRTPGSYPLGPDMRIADLLERAGGLLPRAKRRAKLTRVVAGTAESERQSIDLDLALQGDPNHNVLLREDDLLEVPSAETVAAPEQPVVTVRGPVTSQGMFPLYRGMTVSDLLDDAGRLQPEADREVAYLRRIGVDGRLESRPVDLARAMAGDPDHDIELLPGDLLEVLPLASVTVAPPQVRVAGAVYRPGVFDFTRGMTLGELLHRAGGPTPEAYLAQADLYRRADEGRRRMLAVDLRVTHTLPLEDGDELQVRRIDEAVYREPTVEIRGAVASPGTFPRTEGMTLRDLLWLAGGTLRNPGMMIGEVARARGSEVTNFTIDLPALLDGDEAQNLVLEDGDVAYLGVRGEYIHKPVDVLLLGEVANPRIYPLEGTSDSLRTLLTERAGGLTEQAFAEGAFLLRRVDQVVTPEAARYATEIWERYVVKRERDNAAVLIANGSNVRLDNVPTARLTVPTESVRSSLEELLSERGELTQIEEEVAALLEQTPAALNPAAAAPGAAAAGGAGTAPGGPGSPSEPRVARRFLPEYIRVQIDLPAVLRGDEDLELLANDVIIVPRTPTTVLVQGEVGLDGAFAFTEGQTAAYYVQLAGNFTRDADERETRILHANGTVARYSPRARVARGDIIIVPPRRLELPVQEDPLRTLQVIAQVVGSLATTVLAVGRAFD